MRRTPTSVIWRTVVYAGAALALPACPGGGGGQVCHPVSAEEMPRTPSWDVTPGDPAPTEAVDVFALMVESQPAGAKIFRDGEELGVTPLMIEVEAGPLNLRAELEGYAPAEYSITADQNLHAQVTMVTEEEAMRPTEVCEHRGRGFVLA